MSLSAFLCTSAKLKGQPIAYLNQVEPLVTVPNHKHIRKSIRIHVY